MFCYKLYITHHLELENILIIVSNVKFMALATPLSTEFLQELFRYVISGVCKE